MRTRAFLGLSFSVAVTRRIAEEAARHVEPMTQAGFKVAWVPAANLHVTAKFLGSVPEEALEAVADVLRRALAAKQPFEAHARGLGVFPNECQPRVLWVGVDGGAALLGLVRDVETAMVDLGFEREARPYHPHVTVGRVKEGVGDVGPLWRSDVELGVSLMNELVLYESRTARTGAEYVARARLPLGRASESPRADG
jgi:2'-5' RNA ligase